MIPGQLGNMFSGLCPGMCPTGQGGQGQKGTQQPSGGLGQLLGGGGMMGGFKDLLMCPLKPIDMLLDSLIKFLQGLPFPLSFAAYALMPFKLITGMFSGQGFQMPNMSGFGGLPSGLPSQ